ncbi:glycosyltransferase family 2 protein, partial [bacterium]|nr:glycosyltransferase family 2 protein [bacterium]
VEICRRYTDKIYYHDSFFMSGRVNFGIEKATGDWILNIDPDERVTEELRDEIRQALKNNLSDCSGFFIPFRHYFLGQVMKYGGWWPSYIIRLYKKAQAKYGQEGHHLLVAVGGRVGYLKSPIHHIGFAKSISHFVKKHDFYSSNIALLRYEQGERSSIIRLLVRPAYIFLKRFIFMRGYKDGLGGFILMVIYVFFLFLEEAKLWALSKSET